MHAKADHTLSAVIAVMLPRVMSVAYLTGGGSLECAETWEGEVPPGDQLDR